tara:strand:- start:668 stop:784 length:117 start_codon:yes stop_codon:yes gene_type:complete
MAKSVEEAISKLIIERKGWDVAQDFGPDGCLWRIISQS